MDKLLNARVVDFIGSAAIKQRFDAILQIGSLGVACVGIVVVHFITASKNYDARN